VRAGHDCGRTIHPPVEANLILRLVAWVWRSHSNTISEWVTCGSAERHDSTFRTGWRKTVLSFSGADVLGSPM
jgi:hypothetical protein